MSTRYPIPSKALDDRLAFTGSSGTGKTYDAGTAIEKVLHAKSRACIVDPLGVWWGLRLQSDGKSAGFKVAIFGGPHGDIAITETSGKLIGETVAATQESCIIDLSEFDTEASQRRFMLAFIVALYGGLKGDLLHLVLDEADMWAPQRIQDKEGDATKLHHNVQKIVRRGRVKGFIPWLITQRPAEISKSILSMADGMVMHQALSPQDIGALMDWVRPRADKDTADMIQNKMPAFGRGEAVVYIPRRGVLNVAQFPEKVSFDSSRSPERGERKNRPDIALKPLDIDALKKRLEKVEAEAKANDPNALKAEIARLQSETKRLEKQLSATSTSKVDPEALAKAEERGFERGKKEVAAAADKRVREARLFLLEEFGEQVRALWDHLAAQLKIAKADKTKIAKDVAFTPSPAASPRPAPAVPPRSPPRANLRTPSGNGAAHGAPASGDESLSGPEQRILNSLASWAAMGHDQPGNAQIAWLAGYSPTSTGYTNPRSGLRTKGLIDYPAPDRVALTADGASCATAMQFHGSLLETVLARLPGPERRILTAAAARHPAEASNEEVAADAGYSPTSTGYTNPRSALRTKEPITYPSGGMVRAAEWLFA